MATDWIKMRVDIYRDPKVCLMADRLFRDDGGMASYVKANMLRNMAVTRNVTRCATVGALVAVWGVMRHRGKRVGDSLLCRGITLQVLDDIADLDGFGEAMASVGWALQTEDGVEFPEFFSEYNADPAGQKQSAAADRQRRYRERQASQGVTRDVTRDVTVTHRIEKNREEKTERDSDGDESPDVVIPAAMNTEPVHSAVRLWKRHLEHVAPDKAIIANSPQEQMFWQEISRMGPDRFLAAVEYSVARKYLSLVEKPPPRTAKASGGGGCGMSARDRIRAVGSSGGGDVAR